MTDKLERVFVEIKYDGKAYQSSQVVSDLETRLQGLAFPYQITENRPPKVLSDQELEDRYFHLMAVAEKFRIKYLECFKLEITVDPRLMYLTVISAFADIERYKTYHLEKPYSDRSDAVKRGAYMTKWIARIQPFQTRIEVDKSDPKNLVDLKPALANIFFAIMVSMSGIRAETGTRAYLTPISEFQLAYDILYRTIGADALLSTYQMVVDLIKQREVITIA